MAEVLQSERGKANDSFERGSRFVVFHCGCFLVHFGSWEDTNHRQDFWRFSQYPDEIIAALKFSAKWNRLASIFSAFTALFLIAIIMNPRHAAARALMGWYLMTPPPMSEPERAGLSDPLGG